MTRRTPLFTAQHADRYARQEIIRAYEELTGATLIVLIDAIFPEGLTYLEELLFDVDGAGALHMLLASPGGDGETAIRIVRSAQARCKELTIIVPDMAKSAATLVCLGADRLLMGPAGDLGPVDSQFQIDGRMGLVGANEIVAAVDEAEERVKNAPVTYPLFSALLADVNMLIVEQARSALQRDEALIEEALGCAGSRKATKVAKLAEALKTPLIKEKKYHGAVLSAAEARRLGLPVVSADVHSKEWELIWALWTRYFAIGCFPVGPTSAYEGRRASHVLSPQAPHS